MSLRSLRSWLAMMIAVVLLSACGAKVNEETYGKIQTGMTRQQVEDVLGKPSESKTAGAGPLSGEIATWVSGSKKISVTFMNDKVMVKTKDGF